MSSEFVKNLLTDTITQSQIVAKLISGNATPRIYSPTSTYNAGDLSVVYITSEWKIMVCTTAGTTGAYNPAKWTDYSPIKNSIDCGTF